jgi:site-specific DNA-cytosine methylase
MSRPLQMDLFSGIGGFALAASRAGFQVAQFVEIDAFGQAVCAKNFPGVPIHGDIRTFDARSLRGRIAVLTGGFPCQPFSVSGKRKGEADERFLWPELLRVITECRPTFCLLENVPGLRTLAADRVLQELEEAGYTAGAFVVGADDLGATHRRKRVWIVAQLDDTNGSGQQRDASRTQAIEIGHGTDDGLSMQAVPDVAHCDLQPCKRGSESRITLGSSRATRLEPDGGSTSMADTQGEQNRRLCVCGLPRDASTESGGMADADSAGRCEHCGGEPGGEEPSSPQCRCEALADAERFAEQQQADELQTIGVGRNTRAVFGQHRIGVSDTRNAGGFPPARNDFRGWAAALSVDASLAPCVESPFCDGSHGLSARLVRRRRATRNAVLKGLGNSIIPAVAEVFLTWIFNELEARP